VLPAAFASDPERLARFERDHRDLKPANVKVTPDGDTLAAVLSSTGALSVGDSKRLFEIRAAYGRSTQQAGYAVSPDGRRLVVQLLDPRAIPTRIDVVLNWFEELKAKVPAR
jgi:hypothetical protein